MDDHVAGPDPVTVGPRATAEHHVRIDGRSWRATDPAIPDRLRAELVDELMAARRAVGAARRGHDEAAEHAARRRVQDAKVALGERGRAWWEEPTPEATDERLRATILALCRHRGADRSICPSDAARVVGAERWRDRMDAARAAAVELAADGEVRILARGRALDPAEPLRGPVRIGLVGQEGRR
ncbi:DUF3253 domain-containing protein [Dermatobacter hominis]|uniref:DUF3253 domain-containing protein n=1 Tax=Dermatobacter hominis TaxID=2884263 RepID=UPI001D0FCBB4|nr:DUF3253 domain-containing protein [Dermatobacter hominis]UDY35138.1 DUF3253 domain-containing protein [Dermatobacter hominis]